jgi:hypothetical protein
MDLNMPVIICFGLVMRLSSSSEEKSFRCFTTTSKKRIGV